jgi:GNAT superfamily N-acetyltransferase
MCELHVAGLVIREVGRESMDTIRELNRIIFEEERIINTFDRPHLLMLLAEIDEEPVGFKIGYRENRFVYYSAKGGVLEEYRRTGIARAMMQELVDRVRPYGYRRLAFDTFPNRHPGMTVLALRDGFRVVMADYNHTYRDFRLRFEKQI